MFLLLTFLLTSFFVHIFCSSNRSSTRRRAKYNKHTEQLSCRFECSHMCIGSCIPVGFHISFMITSTPVALCVSQYVQHWHVGGNEEPAAV